MLYGAIEDGYMVHVEKNERIMDTLTGFCVGMGVPNAQLSGIGAIKGSELGAYDMANKEYIRHHFEDIGLPTWCIMARKE